MQARDSVLTSRGDSGAVAIIVALLAVVLFGFAALVVDIGDADVVREQGQSAVDAAALAGVKVLSAGRDVAAVVKVVTASVEDNFGKKLDWAACTDPASLDASGQCISTLTNSDAGMASYQVRVKLPPQRVLATFGGLFGVNSIILSPVAQALSGQVLPPACGPCDPPLDDMGHPGPSTGFPYDLPDPAKVPVAPDPDASSGCPIGPGLFTGDVTVTGVACTLHPGLYVFNNANLDVAAGASIASTLSTEQDGDLPAGTGVTLVFYGTGTLSVEGHIGVLDPLLPTQRDPLVASLPIPQGQTLAPDQPIPGVAIVLDQFGGAANVSRNFWLGDGFKIEGSVYALSPQTVWTTSTRDCPALASTCSVTTADKAPKRSVIATTKTAFADNGRIPTVGPPSDTPAQPPSLPHLVK